MTITTTLAPGDHAYHRNVYQGTASRPFHLLTIIHGPDSHGQYAVLHTGTEKLYVFAGANLIKVEQ
jgi:hypothetical protein